jgi:hypothetical protein
MCYDDEKNEAQHMSMSMSMSILMMKLLLFWERRLCWQELEFVGHEKFLDASAEWSKNLPFPFPIRLRWEDMSLHLKSHFLVFMEEHSCMPSAGKGVDLPNQRGSWLGVCLSVFLPPAVAFPGPALVART